MGMSRLNWIFPGELPVFYINEASGNYSWSGEIEKCPHPSDK
jgi:hypothetical protein